MGGFAEPIRGPAAAEVAQSINAIDVTSHSRLTARNTFFKRPQTFAAVRAKNRFMTKMGQAAAAVGAVAVLVALALRFRPKSRERIGFDSEDSVELLNTDMSEGTM